MPAAYAVEHKLLPLRVKLGQHIVEQQYRIFAGLVEIDLALGKLYGKRGCARLALACEAARVLAVYADYQVVLVRAG